MQEVTKHFHAWILRINGAQVAFEAMPGSYASKITCRRHAYKAAGGDSDKVIVLICRGEETCPSIIQETALAGT